MLQVFRLIAFTAFYVASAIYAEDVECKTGAIDLVFVLDESGSVGEENFFAALDALADMTRSLDIGQTIQQSRVGFVLFETSARIGFSLSSYSNNQQVETAIRNISYISGGTNIASGMNLALTQVFTAQEAAKRPGIPRIMIVLTDGADSTDVAGQHNLAVSMNVMTYALGIGYGVNWDEMLLIAGSQENVFNATSFSALAEVMNQICSVIEGSVAPPEPQGPENFPRECSCTIANLWLDIVFVLDSSDGVNSLDFNAIRGLLISFLNQIRVSQSEGQYSRVAFVNAAGSAIRVGNLTAFGSSNDAVSALINQVLFQGASVFNVGAGLIEAQKILDEAGNRANARNLVIVFSSRNIECSSSMANKILRAEDDPCRIASRMVEDPKTTLLTVALRFFDDQDFPLLTFGSPCFNAVNDQNLLANLVNLACKANCFCQHEYFHFQNEDECHSYGECVYPKGVATPYLAAQISCQLDGTVVAEVENEPKEFFLRQIASNNGQVPYWIGLRKNSSGFYWDNGVALSAGDYSNWGTGQPNTTAGECVAVQRTTGLNMQWVSDQCSWAAPSYYYFCEKNTCDTDNYCIKV